MRAAFASLALPALLAAAPAPAQVADTPQAEHVTLGQGIEGWLYLKREDFSVTRMRLAPGASEDRHLHRKARLHATMLIGTMNIEIGGQTFVVGPGQGIEIPPGTPHRVWNPGAAPIDLIVTAMPPSAGDRALVAD